MDNSKAIDIIDLANFLMDCQKKKLIKLLSDDDTDDDTDDRVFDSGELERVIIGFLCFSLDIQESQLSAEDSRSISDFCQQYQHT